MQQCLSRSYSSGRQEARVLQGQLRQLQGTGGAQRYMMLSALSIVRFMDRFYLLIKVKQQLKDWEKQEKKLRELKAKGRISFHLSRL